MQTQFCFQARASNQTPPAGTANGAVTAAVTQIALPANAPNETECTGRFVNSGTQTIFWAYGTQAGLTVGNGIPMLPGTVETFNIPAGVSTISVIAAAVGSTLYITLGDGA
jgi:hypothetical protein